MKDNYKLSNTNTIFGEKKSMANINELTPREFEVLAANYARSIFPDYNWKITKAVGDYNRDFEAVVDDLSKWGEAKQTEEDSTAVSKGRWDPTLLSAILKNDVDELILVTSGWISLQYVVRARHLVGIKNMISKIIFVNGYLVNEWLKTHEGDFYNFGVKDVDLNSKIIKPAKFSGISKSDYCIIQVFDMYNILEPKNELSYHVPYNILITFFLKSDSNVRISVPNCFNINSVSYENLSDKSGTSKDITAKTIEIIAKQGYNQITISGNGDHSQYSGNSEIKVKINEISTYTCSITIKESPVIDKKLIEEIVKIEKEHNDSLHPNVNSVVNVTGISRNDITLISEKDQRFFYFHFNDSYCENAVELCKILALLIFGIYNDQGEQETIEEAINSTLNYCPTYLSKILIGAADPIYAVDTIKDLSINSKKYTIDKYSVPDRSIIFVEISNSTSFDILKLLEHQLASFKMQYNSSIVILSRKIDDKTADKPENENTNVLELIDKLQNNNVDEKDDVLAQLQKKANEYYNKSDFFRAKCLYDIIFQNIDLKDQNLYEVFKYADSLNHCDSLMQSKKFFTIAAQASDNDDPKREKKILEAQTELFNLRFWSLDVDTLVDDIDKMLEKHSKILLSNNGERALYAYYNCLNRKMVTQYLIGDYENAEKTFDKYIKSINSDNYMNYKAFAYMDSARGLYAKDLKMAECRLKQSHELLEKIHEKGNENRRYLDCNVELAYVDFITEYEKGNEPDIQNLESAVTQVRINGYTSMLIKCNLKLSACYLALGNTEVSSKCLNYVKGSCDFNDNPRVEMLYNNLFCALLSVINSSNAKKHGIAKDYRAKHIITFDTAAKKKINIEPRLW